MSVRLLDDREREIGLIFRGRLAANSYTFAVDRPADAPGLFRVVIESEGWRTHGDIRFE